MRVSSSTATAALSGVFLVGVAIGVPPAPGAGSARSVVHVAAVAPGLPRVATCSDTAHPNRPGPDGQARPRLEGGIGVAMDTESGKIVGVDEGRRTWTFNVCTNTWKRRSHLPATPGSGDPMLMAYSSRRDRVFALAEGAFASYSVEKDRWTPFGRVNRVVARSFANSLFYDAGSRSLILFRGSNASVWAYKPATQRWRRIHASLPALEPRHWLDVALVTFDPGRRELIATHLGARATWNFDIASRRWTRHPGRPLNLPVGWAPSGGELAYDANADRALAFSDATLAAYNPGTHRWRYIRVPAGPMLQRPRPEALPRGSLARMGHTLVYDPVNKRVVLVGGAFRTKAWRPATDVVAYRLATNKWMKLVRSARR